MTPDGNHDFVLDALTNRQGRPIDVAPGAGHVVRIPRPPVLRSEMGLLLRYLPE